VKILNSSAFLIYNPGTVVPMLEAAMSVVPVEKLAVHFHDTYGQSLSNILISLQVTN
jgi:hydroxymethylglutaryl-CoA lyase